MDFPFELDTDLVPLPQDSERGVKDLTFGDLLDEPLKIEVDGGAKGCGGHIWPAGDLLARYAINKKFGGKIVELGSGTGLTGLALAKANPSAHVYITDQDMMLPLMENNIQINELQHQVEAKVLDWGEPLPAFCKDVDVILAADCVYLESAFPLLNQTLLDLTENGAPIFMAYKRRRKADKNFFKKVRKNFDIHEITLPEYADFKRDSVFLFEMTRKPHKIQQ